MEHRPHLPKWPALIVKGEPVTKEQAAEIIIRTARWPILTNNHEFEAAVAELIDVPTDWATNWRLPQEERQASLSAWLAKMSAFRENYGVLELEFLTNQQIASCWVGGPHGWVNWHGQVKTCNYNIGKWPTVDRVLEDWKTIAAAFPYLNLRCQLLDDEAYTASQSEGTPKPLVEFRVAGGEVVIEEPDVLLVSPEGPDSWVGMHGEVGCTLDELKWALEVTAKRVSASDEPSDEGGYSPEFGDCSWPLSAHHRICTIHYGENCTCGTCNNCRCVKGDQPEVADETP